MFVGVHGIAQQQRGENQLHSDWEPALRDGILRAGRPLDQVPLDIAFYGHLFLPPSASGTKGRGTDDVLLGDLDNKELDFLTELVDEIVPSTVGDANPKGRAPRGVGRLINRLDQHLGVGAGVLWLGELRQAHRYLVDPQLKKDVDEIVAEAVKPGTRALIGHSLGSVVAYEYARQNPDRNLELLLTLGSPLRLRVFRDRLPDSGDALAVWDKPPNIQRWVNVSDKGDWVAAAGGLKDRWQGVEDFQVHNGQDPHKVSNYLGKRETGAALCPLLDPVSADGHA